MRKDNDTAILLLAAGTSSRMGRPKQLIKINEEYLLQRVINNILSEHYDLFLVTGSYRQEIISSLDLRGITEVYNADWEEGMGASIREGLRGTLEKKDYSRVIVCVADQVFLNNAVLENLIENSFQWPDKIIASSYDDSLGPPVLFPKSFFNKLLELKRDSGAKFILRKYYDQVITIKWERGSYDIDTPQDLDNYLE